MNQPTLSVVQSYRSLGLAVTPLETGGKRPVWPRWTEPRDPEEVLRYFEQHPRANVGVLLGLPSSHAVCLDLDERGAAATIRDTYPEVRQLPCVLTGRGLHLYLRPKHPEAWPNAKVRLRGCNTPCGELLGTGRQAVAPPSRVQGESSARCWEGGWPKEIPEVDWEPGTLGLEVVRHVTKESAPAVAKARASSCAPKELAEGPLLRPSLDYLLWQAIRRAEPGSRNDTGLWLACQCRDNGYTEAEAAIVLRALVAACPPGEHDYTWQEAEATLKQAFCRNAREPWSTTPSPSRAIYMGRGRGETEGRNPLEVLTAPELLRRGSEPVRWLAEYWIAEAGTTVIAAPAGRYKSWVTLRLLGSIARGEPFAGRPTTKAACLLLDAENGPQVLAHRLRLLGLVDTPELHIAALQSRNLQRHAEAREVIRVALDHGIRVIAVDSLRRYFSGEENSSDALGAFYGEFVLPARAEGLSLLLLHHVRKAGPTVTPGERFRGSSDLVAGADLYLEGTAREAETCFAWEKCRYCAAPEPVLVGVVDTEAGGAEVTFAPLEPNKECQKADAELIARVLDYLCAHRDASQTAIEKAVGHKSASVRAALRALEAAGVLTHVRGPRGAYLYSRANTANVQTEVLDFGDRDSGEPLGEEDARDQFGEQDERSPFREGNSGDPFEL